MLLWYTHKHHAWCTTFKAKAIRSSDQVRKGLEGTTLAVAMVTWLPLFRQADAATSTTVTTLRLSFRVIYGDVGSSQREGFGA